MVKLNQLEENLNIEGKRVLLRVDFNVPISDGAITENSRIEKVLPTIKFLKKKKAKKIILLGMDFGSRIGKYSKTRVISRTTKIKKLRRGKKLLEWLAKKSESNLYSTTKIKGLTKISFQDIDNIITSKNAF